MLRKVHRPDGRNGRLAILKCPGIAETSYSICLPTQLTKKGEISFSKTSAQIEALLPTEMKAPAKEALKACKDVRKYLWDYLFEIKMIKWERIFFPDSGYKDSCDKVYFSVKCAAEFDPDVFFFP